MRILLLGGFLGSGKTSILLQLAQYLAGRESEGGRTKVMIIENEIGEVGVDDKLLKAQGLNVRELFAGCACCTGGADLLSDIQAIKKDYDPDWIVVEATGVAYPLQIKENVESCFGVRVGVLCLADAQRWRRLKNAMSMLIESQLQNANWILLNKSDLASPEQLDEIEADIRGINGTAKVWRTVANQPMDSGIWAAVAEKGEAWE